MNYLDLLSVLRSVQGNALQKAVVFGKITKEIPRPRNIFESVQVGSDKMFVEVEVFGVDLGYTASYLRDNGIKNDDNIYMANGSLVALVDKSIPLGDWYELRGTLRLASKEAGSCFVGLLNYVKQGKEWGILACDVFDMDTSVFSDEEVIVYLNRSYDAGYVIHPEKVNNLVKFDAGQSWLSKFTGESAGKGTDLRTGMTFKKESRKDVLEKTETVKKFQDISDTAKTKRQAFLRWMISGYSDCPDSVIGFLIRHLKEYMTRKPDSHGSTGRTLLKGYLGHFKNANKQYIGGQTHSDYCISCFDTVAEYILDHSVKVPMSDTAWEFCKAAFADKEKFFAGIVSEVTGVSFDLLDELCGECKRNGLSSVAVMVRNPYLMQLLIPIRFDDIEKVAICFGCHGDKNLDKYRNIAMLNDYINSQDDSSTVFTVDALLKADMGVVLTKTKFQNMRQYDSVVSAGFCENSRAYFGAGYWGYQVESFVYRGGRYIKALNIQDLKTAITEYEDSGLGVRLDNYITSARLLDMELFVYNTMHALAEVDFDYAEEDIEKSIAEYESEVGFELTEEQKAGVHLIQKGGFMVSGSAGSGKTTVSRCIVKVLEDLEPELSIKLAAPTGKAAKRMQEVIKRPAKTFHSEFGIGLRRSSSVFELDKFTGVGQTAYFLDECAMASLTLMYQVLSHIDVETDRVYLIGDIAQLPPIGKGLPFKNLLRFMPCQFLTVSKRACDGSGITLNSDIINTKSGGMNWADLKETSDFGLLQCGNDYIPKVVFEQCQKYMEKYNPDDIQVVTPLAKASYEWGAINLNKKLQPLFNKNRGYDKTFLYQLSDKVEGHRFIQGDRVIHTDKNMYSMQWYQMESPLGVFQKIYGYGICNGEVGKVLGFYKADDCMLLEETEELPDNFMYPDSLRDDSTWTGDYKYFVAVQYYDYIGERDIVILYRADVNTYIESNEGIVFKGEDLGMLSLFYAGTTHKLQGSEAKVVICALGSVNYRGFITREMVYTMITRGKVEVEMIGSVGSSRDSQLSKARMDLASGGVLTIGEMLV